MKPILFNTEMVRAILDNRKTVTRRVVKPQSKILEDPKFGYTAFTPKGYISVRGGWKDEDGEGRYGENFIKLPYRPGDTLYVRETFTKYQTVNYIRCHDGRAFSEVSDGQFAYKADGYESIDDLKDDIRLLSDCSFEAVEVWDDKWHPSIHMPREAARIFLRVTDVRMERLQNMNMNDKQAEGVVPGGVKGGQWQQWQHDYMKPAWNSTIKPKDLALYGWEANPWVWAIGFERISKEEAENVR